jgi:hypothetical protein
MIGTGGGAEIFFEKFFDNPNMGCLRQQSTDVVPLSPQ